MIESQFRRGRVRDVKRAERHAWVEGRTAVRPCELGLRQEIDRLANVEECPVANRAAVQRADQPAVNLDLPERLDPVRALAVRASAVHGLLSLRRRGRAAGRRTVAPTTTKSEGAPIGVLTNLRQEACEGRPGGPAEFAGSRTACRGGRVQPFSAGEHLTSIHLGHRLWHGWIWSTSQNRVS